MPGVTYFKPAGIPCKLLEENRLSMEEIESVRLRDLEHMEQMECAQKMNISRQTFQRILASARKKIADSLLAGKALRIEGGNYEISANRHSCSAGHEWDEHANLERKPGCCPVCNLSNSMPLASMKKKGVAVKSPIKSIANK